jgi:Holliday junction resolvasome RuvABC ATP-dependent DNA helicase subunit
MLEDVIELFFLQEVFIERMLCGCIVIVVGYCYFGLFEFVCFLVFDWMVVLL